MRLATLLQQSDISHLVQLADCIPDVEVHSLTDDSRLVKPGVIFCATEQGRPYRAEALKREASVLVIDVTVEQKQQFAHHESSMSTTCFLYTEHLLEVQGKLAAGLYDFPSRSLFLAGITGTNGKTTVAHMIYHIWKSQGESSAMIGTNGVRLILNDQTEMLCQDLLSNYRPQKEEQEIVFQCGYTTPRAGELQRILYAFVKSGIKKVIIEVSSEALALGRLHGTEFSLAMFSNLSPEHLNFHGDMENYFQAKLGLFNKMKKDGRAVIDAGESYGERASRYAKLHLPDRVVSFVDPAPGTEGLEPAFNRRNATLALYGVAETETEHQTALQALRSMPPVPGRFNLFYPIGVKEQDYFTVVDYAHTPDALKNLLQAVRQMDAKKLILVFGCGGDRDRTKRRLMGEIAARYADVIIVTDDNPRTENPDAIRREIIKGCQSLKPAVRIKIIELASRKTAITCGLELARNSEQKPAGLVIAGKGHETGQIFKDRVEHFSDIQEVKQLMYGADTEIP